MQNRRYNLIVTDHRPFRPYLEVDVISTIYPNHMSICSIPLTQLATHEVGLQDGRFINFATATQEHLVGLWLESCVEEHFTDRLSWIAQNVKHEWYCDVQMENVHKVRVLWSFQDAGEAILFKLSF